MKPGANLWICHVDPRDKLNSFHRGRPPRSRATNCPTPSAMVGSVEQAGLTVQQLLDGPETGYLLHAEKTS
ncbi:hypothetical protein HS125_05865 [bacterium]|nr:hypothetical protein [bacterium]